MKDPIERQDAIDMLNVGAELLRRVLDDADVVGADREKYSWGLGLIESYIDDIEELPSAQSERETGTWIIDSAYPQHCWCSNCNHRFDLFDPKSIHFCPNCGREMKTCIWKSLDEREKE